MNLNWSYSLVGDLEFPLETTYYFFVFVVLVVSELQNNMKLVCHISEDGSHVLRLIILHHSNLSFILDVENHINKLS